MNRTRTALICVGILAAGAATTALIFSTEPKATRTGAVRRSAMLVDVVTVERGTFRPAFAATGTVEPERDVILSPRVSGQVVRIAPSFTPGGTVRAGDALVWIDPSDYEIALTQARSELGQALADLDLEMGLQNVARKDLALLEGSVPEDNQSLVLREPQLETVRARVEAARAAVRRAELDLERTTITAPFDAHILARNANVGAQVAPGDDLGRIVGVDAYRVALTVPLSKLRWLEIPGNGRGTGSEVILRDRTAWSSGESRRGTLHQLVGALEPDTRMARVLATVQDPLARRGAATAPPLIIGSFVEADIRGREVSDAVRIDRDHLRDGNRVWLMKDGVLRIRDVEILLEDARYAYVTDGLADGDSVVTTHLASVTDGAPLRVEEAEGTDSHVDTLATQGLSPDAGAAAPVP